MHLDYPSLTALAAVVREGTFEAAARSLNITQSAVSQRIKALEEKTGAVLVVRGRPCVATEYGHRLIRHIEQVQVLEIDLAKNLQAVSGRETPRPAALRIAVNNDSLATWFPEVILRAGTQLNLHFDIVGEDQRDTAELLRNGDALAVVTSEGTPLQGCRRIVLGAMDYLTVATPAFIARHFPDGVTPEAVSRAPCLFYNRKDMLPEHWLLDAFGSSFRLIGHRLPSFAGLLQCIHNGTGWGLMPRQTIRASLDDGTLRELVPGSTVVLGLYWQASVQSSEIMRVLSSIVADVARTQLLPFPLQEAANEFG